MAKLNVVIPNAEVTVRVDGGETVTYRKVDRAVREGDIVQAFEESIDITYGGFYAVVSADDECFTFIDDGGDDRLRGIDDEDFVVYEKVEVKPESDDLFTYRGEQYRKVKRRAAVGELCLRTKRWVSSPVGSVTKAKREGVEQPIGADGEGLFPNYYVVLEPVKSAEPPKPATPPARIPVGSYVKTPDRERNYASIERGAIGKVVEDDYTIVPYKVEALNGIKSGWYKADELTVLSEAEAKAAVEAEAERQKWAAIGRKVGEYKNGDVVKCVGSANAGYGEVLKEVNGRYSVKYSNPTFDICAETTEIIALIVPVEQRFDRKATEGASS